MRNAEQNSALQLLLLLISLCKSVRNICSFNRKATIFSSFCLYYSLRRVFKQHLPRKLLINSEMMQIMTILRPPRNDNKLYNIILAIRYIILSLTVIIYAQLRILIRKYRRTYAAR